MTAEGNKKFQLQQYYEVLMSVNIKQKLKPFVRQFKRKNISFIYQTIANTIQIIIGPRELPLMKFNALMATKLFFDTGEYVPIVLIEIYLLPIIFDIAFYRIQKRSEEGLTLYFIEKGGFDSTKQIKRMGFNYVLLAIQFIFMSAHVKPYRNLENQELKEESNYSRVSKLLQDKGLQPIQNYKFYIPSYVNQTRKKYLKRLMKLNNDEYTNFFLKLICDEINIGKKPELDTKKLFVYGDAYITIPLMHICEDELTKMETNFVNKKKYLNLIGDFMKLGDIYAVLIITRSSFLQNIFEKIQKVKGQTGFQAGEGIYPEIEASKSDKKQFYVQFLKHIEIWATCHPVDEDGEPTDAKKIFDILKTQKKFIFPSNILLSKVQKQMELNLKINQKRNEKLIKLVDENSLYGSKRHEYSSQRGSKVSLQGEPLNGNSYIQCDQLEEMVLQAKDKLKQIAEKQDLEPTIRSLQNFKKTWNINAQKNEIQADDSADIEIVLEEGNLCVKIIEMVLPVYTLYTKNIIPFGEYKERVTLLMKKETNQDEIKQVSFENNLPLETQKSGFLLQNEKSSLNQLHSNINKSDISVRRSDQLQNQKLQQPYQILQKSIHSRDQKNEGLKQESDISFHQESIVSSQSNLKKISEKQSNKSSSLLQQESFRGKNTFAKQQSSKKIDQNINQSGLSLRSSKRSSLSKSSNRSLKRNLQRNKSPSQHFSQKSSNKSINYKDILTKNKLQRQNQDYYQSEESFISSQRSIPERFVQKNPSVFKPPVAQRSIQQVNISQSISINSQYGLSKGYGPIYTLNGKNEDYYGVDIIKIQENSQSRLSRKSGRPRIERKSELSASKLSSSKLSIKNRNVQNNENNFTETIRSPNSSLKQQEKSDSLRNAHKNLYLNKSPSRPRYQPQQSIINQPQASPLLHSFHQQSSSITTTSKANTFKQCFDFNNEIILAKEGKNKLLVFTKTGKIANFIQTTYTRQTPKNSTIVDIISERNAKKSIESYRNMRQKSRANQTLSQRMKSLQSFNKNMRMKIIVQNQQSRNQIPKSQQQFSHLKGSRKNGSEPVSFYNDSSSQQKSEANLKSQTGQVFPAYEFLNQSRLINPKIYNHYFPLNKADKFKKCMLKSKSLLLKNEQYQIGCVTSKRQKCVQISLFITPMKATIQDINISIANDRNLIAKISSRYIQKIKINQQQYINIEFQVDNVPFVIPTLSIKFKSNSAYQQNYLIIPIPISFNKFFTFHPISQEYHQQTKNRGQDVISTQFRYNSKFINSQKIKENLNQFGFIKNQKKCSYFGSEVYFQGKIFVLKFIINQNGTMNLQGKNMTGDHKNTKFLEFLLITFRQIFESIKIQKAK